MFASGNARFNGTTDPLLSLLQTLSLHHCSADTSLDLTLVGSAALSFFTLNGFFVPGVHSRPLSERDPDIAPALVALREKLMAMVQRPVNIQASRNIVIQFRGGLLDQPYLTLLEKPDTPEHPSLVEPPPA